MKRIGILLFMWCLLCISFASAQENSLIPIELEPITLENIDRLVELATMTQPDEDRFDYSEGLSINADNTLLALTNIDRNVWYWDLRTGELTIIEENNLGDTTSSVVFSPTKPNLLSSCDRLWDLQDNIAIEYETHFEGWQNTNCNLDVAFSPDGLQIVVATPMTLYDLYTGTMLLNMEILPIANIDDLIMTGDEAVVGYGVIPVIVDIDFSPDGTMIAYTWDWNPLNPQMYVYQVRLIDLADGGMTMIQDADSLNERPSSIAFNPDNTLLAIGRAGGVSIWDIEAEREIAEIEAMWNSIEFSTDGELVLIGDETGIRAWRYATDDIITLTDNEIRDLVLSYDGRLLASLDTDYVIRLWGVPVEE